MQDNSGGRPFGLKNTLDTILGFFSPRFLRTTRNFAIFALAYSLLFWAVTQTLPVSIPLLLALMIAWALQRPIKLLTDKLHFSRSLASLVMTLLVFLIIAGLLVFAGYLLTKEILSLISYLKTVDLQALVDFSSPFVGDLDPAFTEALLNIEGDFLSFLMQAVKYVGNVLTWGLQVIGAIPAWVIIILVVVMGTFFFSRDLIKLNGLTEKMLSAHGQKVLNGIFRHGRGMIGRYLLAYVQLMLITFGECLLLYTIAGTNYVLVFSITTAIADLLPILGPGLIINSLAVISFATGN